MANGFGFLPIRHPSGEIRVEYFDKDSSATAIFRGAPVTLSSDGSIDAAAGGDNLVLGIAAKYSAASTADAYMPVYVDPDIEYIALADDTTIAAQTDFVLNYEFSLPSPAGSTTTGQSYATIDGNTGATTQALPFKVLGLYDQPNKQYGSQTLTILRCKINSSEYAGSDTAAPAGI